MKALEQKIHEQEYQTYQRSCKNIQDRIGNVNVFLQELGQSYQ